MSTLFSAKAGCETDKLLFYRWSLLKCEQCSWTEWI